MCVKRKRETDGTFLLCVVHDKLHKEIDEHTCCHNIWLTGLINQSRLVKLMFLRFLDCFAWYSLHPLLRNIQLYLNFIDIQFDPFSFPESAHFFQFQHFSARSDKKRIWKNTKSKIEKEKRNWSLDPFFSTVENIVSGSAGSVILIATVRKWGTT